MNEFLAHPEISPVLIQLGPLAIRYYGLAYLAGIVVGVWLIRRVLPRSPVPIPPPAIDDFTVYAAIGAVAGGRLGQVLVYAPGFYLAHPLEILQI